MVVLPKHSHIEILVIETEDYEKHITLENLMMMETFEISLNPNILICNDKKIKFNIEFISGPNEGASLIINIQAEKSVLSPRLEKGVAWTLSITNVELSVDTLVHWGTQNPTELNFLRLLLIDLIAIVDEWSAIEKYRIDILYIALHFFKTHYHLHPQFPEIRNNIIKRFYELSKEKGDSELSAVEFNRELFIDDNNQPWFDKEETAISREELARQTVEYLFKYKIPENLDERDIKQGIIRIRNELEESMTWFLSRYDLKMAFDIATHVFRIGRIKKFIFLYIPDTAAFFIFLSSLTLFLYKTCNINYYFNIEPFIHITTLFYSIILRSLYLFLFIIPFIFLFQSKSKNPSIIKILQLFLPRLIAGIMAGYLLLMSDEVWRFISVEWNVFSIQWEGYPSNWVNFPGWIIILKSFLPLIGVYIYIFIEISHVKGIINVSQKSRLFFSRAYSYSIIMGLMVSDIFGDSMIKKDSTIDGLAEFITIQGFVGHIYPQVLICLAPLSLFVGIVIQLLWDDKKLTDKI